MKYFAMIDGRQTGPLELDQMVEAGVRPDTYVWCKGMADWVQAREVADICRFFRQRLFDKMHPAPVLACVPAANNEADVEDLPDYGSVRARIEHTHRNVEPDHSEVPRACSSLLLVLAFLAFFPLGILAIVAKNSARKAWEENRDSDAHDAARRSKMLAGMAICFGLMIAATIIKGA